MASTALLRRRPATGSRLATAASAALEALFAPTACIASTTIGSKNCSTQQWMAARHLAQHGHQCRGFAAGAFVRRRAPPSGSATDRGLPPRNEQIQADPVRLVFPEEERRETAVLSLQHALGEARKRGQDLVMMSPGAEPPVVRIVDWDKVMYGLRKKEKATIRKQRDQRRLSVPKEIRVGCHTAEHDLQMKLGQARRFLEEGYHLRVAVTFKGGREIALARQRLGMVLDQLAELITVKDARGLQRPMMNQWVVQLAPALPKEDQPHRPSPGS